ncbi:DMT family transporter [Streptomyces sp. HNM0575]|uniref:DMT family transporter n=1 Tax=Streptomyces sp. HNM0575 TaxID=2716338 RepID=UPI0019D1810A|nr:DMT family transporter [Streptomyces sp. HNM0575]
MPGPRRGTDPDSHEDTVSGGTRTRSRAPGRTRDGRGPSRLRRPAGDQHTRAGTDPGVQDAPAAHPEQPDAARPESGTGDKSGTGNKPGTGGKSGTGTGNGSRSASASASGSASGAPAPTSESAAAGSAATAPTATATAAPTAIPAPARTAERAPSRVRRLGSALLRHPVAAPVLLATVLHLLWLWLLASGGGDLAAQDAWAEFVGEHPDSAYNLAWYGGLHPFSYSVLSPYLMAWFGVRSTLILAGILSAGLLALILRRVLRRPLAPALWGAFSFTCNAASGRVTFALGVLFALAAVAMVWAWPRRWWRGSGKLRVARGAAAAVLAALATTGSPVAGLFLEVVAAALFLDRRRQAAYALAVAPPVVVALCAVLFPFQGLQPIPWWSALFPLAGALPAFLLVPRSWRTVRLGALVYAAGVVLTWLIPSQVGSNVERLSLLFGVVVLLAAAPLVVRGEWRSRRGMAMAAALVIAAGWQIGKPSYDVFATTPDDAWTRELGPLVQQLKRVDASRGRVEVVPVRSHREASALAPYVNLARGWNRQADTDRNPVFYENGGLTEKSYHRWLRRWAVRYVVLPSSPPDGAGKEEAEIVRRGQPYLKEVWSGVHWRLYRVADPLPMAEPPASVEHAGAGEVRVRVRERGAVLVRIPWSPWLGLVDREGRRIEAPQPGSPNLYGCVRKARPQVDGPPPPGRDEPLTDTWTLLEAPRPGTYRLAAPYRLPRGTTCPGRSASVGPASGPASSPPPSPTPAPAQAPEQLPGADAGGEAPEHGTPQRGAQERDGGGR